MVYWSVISAETKGHLELLGPAAAERGFRLVGGTAAALQLGHRRSEDLDFFAIEPFDVEHLTLHLPGMDRFRPTGSAQGTLHGELGGTKISWLHYPFPWLTPPVVEQPCHMAGLEDIAAMKLSAIAARGSRKDFADLFVITTRVMTFEEALTAFEQKFHGKSFSKYHLLRSLCYFDDAEQEPPLVPHNEKLNWDEIKSYFLDTTKRLQGG